MEFLGNDKLTGRPVHYLVLPSGVAVEFSSDGTIQSILDDQPNRTREQINKDTLNLREKEVSLERARELSLAFHLELNHPDHLDQPQKMALSDALIELHDLYPGIHPKEIPDQHVLGEDVCPIGPLLEVRGVRGETPVNYLMLPIGFIMYFEDGILIDVSQLNAKQFCEEISDMVEVSWDVPDIHEVYEMLRDMQRRAVKPDEIPLIDQLVDSVADTLRKM